jgi:hypothetical protein
MPVMDEALGGILAALVDDLKAANLHRQRGGIAKGTSWAEISGRGSDGSWVELRVRHMPTERRLEATLLAYQPLGRGGKTLALGERSLTYRLGTAGVADALVGEIKEWLAALEAQTCSS